MFGGLGRAGVRLIDSLLIRQLGVTQFTQDPACILRIAHGVAPHDYVFADGTRVTRGEPVLALHFWNEHLPQIGRGDKAFAWGLDLTRRFRYSMKLLARYLKHAREWDEIRVLHGDFGFWEESRIGFGAAVVARLGLDLVPQDAPGWNVFRYAFWANLFSWWLVWTFHPASMQGKKFAQIQRGEIWMSRARLMQMYGGDQ
jgi:hypothetical protein